MHCNHSISSHPSVEIVWKSYCKCFEMSPPPMCRMPTCYLRWFFCAGFYSQLKGQSLRKQWVEGSYVLTGREEGLRKPLSICKSTWQETRGILQPKNILKWKAWFECDDDYNVSFYGGAPQLIMTISIHFMEEHLWIQLTFNWQSLFRVLFLEVDLSQWATHDTHEQLITWQTAGMHC